MDFGENMINAPLPTQIENLEAEAKRLSKLAQEARVAHERALKLKRKAELEHLRPIAKKMHSVLCPYNHCDACGWGYEIKEGEDDWGGHEHDRWLSRVQEILNPPERKKRSVPITAEKLVALLDHVEVMKEVYPDALYVIRHELSR